MRVDKLLSNKGYGSRKEVKTLLKKGCLTVNGHIVKDGKIHVHPQEDIVEIFGERVIYNKYIYLMMNKPKGVISATEDTYERTVIDLLDQQDALYEPFPVGRLDKDTTGLMLLTNDGKLAHLLTSPKKKVDKTYLVYINEPLTTDDVVALENGVELDDGYVTKPATVHLILDSHSKAIKLTIREGKFHQVKRMIQARGKKVVSLKRERIGPIQLDEDLPLGAYRVLTDHERTALENHKNL